MLGRDGATPPYRPLASRVWLLVLTLAFAASGGASILPRTALKSAVAICAANDALTTSALPCRKVVRDPQGGGDPRGGYVIVREPWGRGRTILAPIRRVEGVEDPRLLEPGGPNYFAMAWRERGIVATRFPAKDPWDDMALAINARQARTQDQLHIHIGCVKRRVRRIIDGAAVSTGRFAALRHTLYGRRYAIAWFPADRLDELDPFRLVADGIPGAASDMARQSIAVIGRTRPDGMRGFVVLANRFGDGPDEGPGAESVVDPACSR